MDPQKLTESCQKALQHAQAEASRRQQQAIEVEHLTLALLQEPDGLFPRLLERLKVSTSAVRAALEAELARMPRVSGPGASPGQVYLSQRMSKVLAHADDERKKLNDEFVS